MTRPRTPGSGGIAPAANHSLPMLLLRVRETVLVPLRPVFQDFHLTEQQARVLVVLHEAGTLEMLALAEACCTHAPSLSRMIPKLHALGWIGRHKPDGDLRRVLVELTPEGHAVAASLVGALGRAYGGLTSRIGEGHVRALSAELEATLAALGTAAPTEAPGPPDGVGRSPA